MKSKTSSKKPTKGAPAPDGTAPATSRAPELRVEAWPIDRPKPYARNPRRNDAAVDKVAASIREFGWDNPIVVDKDGCIIAGHTRLKAAKKLGLKTVPVLVRADLTPEQVAALRLADNKTAELAEWDEPLLAAELDALVGAVDMEQFGFDLSAPTGTEGQTDEDAVPEPPPEPVSRRGAVYALGRHRLMCGDSTSAEDVARLMAGEKADMVFTDPPYGMKLEPKWNGVSKNGGIHSKHSLGNDYSRIIGDGEDFNPDFIRAILSIDSRETFIFGADYFAELIPSRNDGSWIVWDKCSKKDGTVTLENGIGSNFELCWSRNRHKRELARFMHKGLASIDSSKRYHPTQKPVALAEWFLQKYGKPEDSVCDLFLGSGTTVLACEKTGRVCYGMELDPHYCDVIRKRWAEFVHGEGCDWQTLAPEVDA